MSGGLPVGVRGRRPAHPGQSIERFFQLSLLGLVSSGYLAMLGSGFLDKATIALAAAGLLWRAAMLAGLMRADLPRAWLPAGALLILGFYPLDWQWVSHSFLRASVHLVCFFAVWLVVGARTSREYGLLMIMAFLELLAAAILSANLNFFLFLTLFLAFAVASFAGAEMRRSLKVARQVAPAPGRLGWRLATSAVLLATGILMLTGVLFFVLPRTAQAAFRRLAPQRFHLPGFANEVALGQIGRLQQSHRPLMRVRILGSPPGQPLKWRGVALSRFDGRRWSNLPYDQQVLPVRESLLMLPRQAPWRPGQRLSYEVSLSPEISDTLFFAGTPELLWINLPSVIRGPNDSFRPYGAPREALRYGVHSLLPEESTAGLPPRPVPAQVLECCLALPPVDPRIPELARRLTEGFTSAEASARAIESYLRRNYRYTTELPSRSPEDPLAYFLFERRQGHCEYFASALAVLLRTIGIPTRLVTGFQGGQYNPVSGWYVIRASDAHSWVEAYLPASGWTTLDPTPPGERDRRFSAFARLALYLDAADTFWQEWVLGYDLTRQLALASRMENSGRSFGTRWLEGAGARLGEWWRRLLAAARRDGLLVLAALAAAVLSALALPRLLTWKHTRNQLRKLRSGQAAAGDATLLYQRMLGALKRRGYSKPVWVTPLEFAGMLPEGELRRLVWEFTESYNSLRFGGRRQVAALLLEALEALEKRLAAR